MRLSSKLTKRGDALRLAKKLGVSPSTVTRWRDGECIPGSEHMNKLRAEYGADITADDFYPPVSGRRAKRVSRG